MLFPGSPIKDLGDDDFRDNDELGVARGRIVV